MELYKKQNLKIIYRNMNMDYCLLTLRNYDHIIVVLFIK